MITYVEWKKQIVEASVNINQQIDDLVQSTAQEIGQIVQDYIDNNASPQRSSPSSSPTPGPFEKLGQAGRAIGRAVTPDLNVSAGGSPLKNDPQGPPSRRDRIRSRSGQQGDIPHKIAHTLFNPGDQEDPKSPWYKKLAGRLGNWARSMKKENIIPENLFSLGELKSILAENGIKGLFLIETNLNNGLYNNITALIQKFGNKVKEIAGGSTPSVSTPPRINQGTRQPPQSGGLTQPTMVSTPTEPTGPQRASPSITSQEDPIKAAKRAFKFPGRGKNYLQAFMNNMFPDIKNMFPDGVPDNVKIEVLNKLFEKLGMNKGQATAITKDTLKNGGFPKEVIEDIKKGGITKPASIPEPAPTSVPKPEPELIPTEPEEEPEIAPKRKKKPEREWHKPTEEEIHKIKNPPHSIRTKQILLTSLVNGGVNPIDVVNLNPRLRPTMRRVLYLSDDKELKKIADKIY